VRATNLAETRDFYVGKLDFRVVAEWPFAGEQSAYLAPPNDDHFYIEVLGGGDKFPAEVRPYTDLGDSLKYSGYHHLCLKVDSVDETIAKLRRAVWRLSPNHSSCLPSAASWHSSLIRSAT